jgi:hypothetical protein
MAGLAEPNTRKLSFCGSKMLSLNVIRKGLCSNAASRQRSETDEPFWGETPQGTEPEWD